MPTVKRTQEIITLVYPLADAVKMPELVDSYKKHGFRVSDYKLAKPAATGFYQLRRTQTEEI